MGMANFRGIIVIVTFLSVILLCLSTMAAQSPELFTTPSGSGPNAKHTTPSEMLSWNKTDAFYLNSSKPTEDYEVPDWHYTFWVGDNPGGPYGIYVNTYDLVLGFIHWNIENLEWFNETTGMKVSNELGSGNDYMMLSTFTNDYDADARQLEYRLTNSRGSLHIIVYWNVTTYGGDADAAFAGSGIWFSLRQDWSDRITTLNLLDILSGLFLGSIFGANTLGIDPLYSAIITIVLDAAAVYMIAMLVRSFIPFLPGGGD